nr:hypothetical protein CFP56_01269 [Quercus suber]
MSTSSERDESRDRDAGRQHQYSFSESSGRASVPMWDSSDPDRAPPPLPLNPGSNSPTTKPNTSAGIAAAAKAIVERARESAPLSSYTTNATPQGSPERSLVKGAHHRRLQSLQTGNVKDLRSYLDNNRSPERSPERPTERSTMSSYSRQSSREDIFSSERASTPTPAGRDPSKETPVLRPSTRQPPRSIIGENTPPSATMLALQTMQVPDLPFTDITNGATTPTTPRVNTNYDFSHQLFNITNIATKLEKEMSSLSRRSKDNATDLISLKEATSQRDEDIRRSLRELANHFQNSAGLLTANQNTAAKASATLGNSFLDSKPFSSPPSAVKSYSVPRAASAHSFLDDMRMPGSPSPYSIEGAASVAMLEKIVREMVTKEGQDRLLGTLSELLEKSRKENGDAAKKVEELADFIKEKSQSQALVQVAHAGAPPKLEFSFDSPSNLTNISRGSGGPPQSDMDDEILRTLKRITESIKHAGGATGELKNMVHDARGQILGQGRELGEKLEKMREAHLNNALDRSIEDNEGRLQAHDVQQIVEESVADLKEHLSSLLAERAEQDDNTFKQLASTRSGPGADEMYVVVKSALAEHGETTHHRDLDHKETSSLDREGVLEAVKEGLKDFEPNIELQQFGLERDEILAVLKEGLEDYQRELPDPLVNGIDKGEVYEAMQEAMKDFQAPVPPQAMEQIKDDMLANIRDMLAEYKPSSTDRSSNDDDFTRSSIIEAVKECLVAHGPAAPREFEISRDDLFDAVKASLDGSTIPFGHFGEQVVQRMQELIEGMRGEFQQYSAANGRDTEQVLDAVKDGLESLRAEIESYVDRAQDVTGKDEIVDTVRGGLEQLRGDIQSYCAKGPEHDNGKAEMLEYIRAEFEHLHEALGSREASRELNDDKPQHTAEIIMAIKDGMESLKSHVGNNHSRSLNEDVNDQNEEVLEAMKEEFEQLKAAVLNAHAGDKDELIETIQDSMGALHSKLGGSELSAMTGGMAEEIIQELHAEFTSLKEQMHTIVDDAVKEPGTATLQQCLEDLREQLLVAQSNGFSKASNDWREELDRFRDSLATSMVVGANPAADYSEHLASIKSGIDQLKETLVSKEASASIPDELIEAMRGEFEHLRTSIASTTVVHGGSNDEVLDAVRLGLDDLRSHLERKLDNPERNTSQHSEMLDAINDGLENLRADVVKTLDKPLDMTVNYEILDTLKDGMAGLRSDLEALKKADDRPATATAKGGEIVLADSGDFSENRGLSGDHDAAFASHAANSAKRTGVEGMEVLLAQLQIKIEAMEATVHDLPEMRPAQPAAGTAMKEDLAELEVLIKEVQAGVAVLNAREALAVAPDSAARKEDTDAIETLLRNTKSRLDEMSLPDFTNNVTKEHLDQVEAVIRLTNEAVDALAEKLENTTAAKADVAVVEVLAQDVKAALEELKEIIPISSDQDKSELMTKADLDILGVLCTEIKSRVNEIALPDPEGISTKADIDQLQTLIMDFRESHDKLKDSYETDIAVTAKAFDDRKKEFEDTVQEIISVKDSLADIKDELIAKISDGELGINTLGETLKGLEQQTGNHEPVLAEVSAMVEAFKADFERTHDALEVIRVDQVQSAESALERQSDHKEATITEINEKLQAYFDGLMTKYDDAQLAAEEKVRVMEEQAVQQQELLSGTKAMTDDLKLSIDTLGTALTTFTTTYPEHSEKMAEESKTVFNRVDDTFNKLEETQQGLRHEHSITREEVSRVMNAIDALHGDVSEHNPRFLVTLQEVQALLGQHYNQAQKATEAAAEHHQVLRELQTQLKTGFEDTKTHHESQTEAWKTALPTLLPPPIEAAPATPAFDRYDDTALHEKLDKIIGHAEDPGDSAVQLERLDQIHEKVMATAAEVTAFVTAQAKQTLDEHMNKEKEAEEIALLLERRMVQKDEIEADITVLNAEKDSLRQAVETLKAEKEALATQKSRVSAEVASLETALRIRRDELHEMDQKAETIERRMLEGVMNQSRMLLLSKGSKPAAKKKPQQGRDLRIPSNASTMSAHTVTSSVAPLKASHTLAMKSRPAMQRTTPNTAERRIMSLSQINRNVPTGAQAFSTALPSLVATGPQPLKRSHSVKTDFTRKGSLNLKRKVSLSTHNKENETLSEQDEDELANFEHPASTEGDFEDGSSDAATERRHSYISGAGSGLTYDDGSYTDDVTPGSEDGRRISYGTASDLDGRDSLDSSAIGILGMHSERSDDNSEEGEEFTDAEDPTLSAHDIHAAELARAQTQIKHFYAPPSDSGLGTELPTATFDGSERDYFPGERK